MSTTRVMVTALPWSLAPDATHHVTAFVTLKLTPEADGATLGDFPAAGSWVDTMRAGTWELLTDGVAAPLPLTVVDDAAASADEDAWVAALPADTPVAGFPAPVLSDKTWNSFPASRMSDHAIDLHIASLTASPTGRPAVLTNPAVTGLLDRLGRSGDTVRVLRDLAEGRATRADASLARRTAEAQASLGVQQHRDGPSYPTQDESRSSALEVLFRDADLDDRATAMLDAELGKNHGDDPETGVLVDAHATRRYYDRTEEQTSAYQPAPTPDQAQPRTDRPAVPDVHARIASFGSTPVLLRRLGLVVDLALDADGVGALADATWVAVRFVPAADADVTRQAPPRTRVTVAGERIDAVSSSAWVTGAVPLGDDNYVVLDLDPDASGLKLDQHLRSLPRLAASEANGDVTTSAPASLRTSGFGIARTDRVDALRDRTARAESLSTPDDADGVVGPDLTYDDLVRGVRLEVWDDVTSAWHSLHERTVSVTAGGSTVLDGAADVGFLQLSALNRVPGSDAHPYYLHEVVAGWDGWSLSAPRPGKVIVHQTDGSEKVVDAPEDEPVTGVSITTTARPGSLPRLRWGTSYAFRLVGVDLAGGAVLRPPDPAPGVAPTAEAVVSARHRLDRLAALYASRDARGLLSAVRDRVRAALPTARPAASGGPAASAVSVMGVGVDATEVRPSTPRRRATPARATASTRSARATARVTSRATTRAAAPAVVVGAPPLVPVASAPTLPEALRTGSLEIDGFLAQQVVAGRQAVSETTSAFARVAEATATLVDAADASAGGGSWRVRPQLQVNPEVLAGLLGAVADDAPAIATTPRPYLRWAPVPPPTLVARHVLTTGEQLSRLVVRTGLPADSPDLVATSERHVVPPKTTQLDAETAGLFDPAIGSGDAGLVTAAYAIALAERGTLLDEQLASLTDARATVTQPGMGLASRPSADSGHAVTLAEITADRETQLAEGQYVVHDVDDLVLPYLPDPHAAGVALVFYDAGAPHVMSDPRPLQSVVLPFPVEPEGWPREQPLRLVLTGGPVLGAELDGRVVTVTVPPGEQVRVAMSSSLRREDLDDFGLWRSHLASTVDPDGDGSASQDEVVAAEVLMRAAAHGWTWWLTPSVDVRLVHAVPAPARVPQLLSLTSLTRPAGLTVAVLTGVADVHGASTERLVVRADWTEWVDDVATPAPVQVARQDVVVDSPVGAGEHWGLLWLLDFQPFGPSDSMAALEDGGIGVHRAIATFPDTHARTLTCTPSGATRYAEFFTPDELPASDDPALRGDPVTVVVPSSARPTAPDVSDTVPLLRWEEGTEPEQPFAFRRVRRSGVRVWLRRPWFSSGDGELLGIVVARGTGEPAGSVSQWGRDPVVIGAAVTSATSPPLLEGAHLLLEALTGTAVERRARPVLPVAAVPLADVDGTPTASVFAYRPEFHPERGEWFVDIALDEGPQLWPFVRLAVARYQPSSIAGASLSPVALTSWAQPLPTRTTTVSRPDAEHVRVTVSGSVAFLRTPGRGPAGGIAGGPPEVIPGDELDGDTPTGELLAVDAVVGATRVLHARLQRLPAGATDLQWETVATKQLRVVGVVPHTYQVTWAGELALDRPLEPRTPGAESRLRVLVEEEELLDADAPDPTDTGMPPVQVPRTVYLDMICL